jgi:uncharacterized membrane protein YebE (DUF533 family)
MDALRLLGSLLGNNATSSGQGEQILGQLIGGLMGGNTRSGGTGGGLADVLGGLMGGGVQSGRAGGGLTDVLSGLTGGGAHSGGAGGGLADILGGLTGGAGFQGGTTHGGSGSSLLGGLVMAALQMLSQRGAATGQSSLSLAEMLGSEQVSPMAMDTSQAHRQALAFVKAMINAAKADGQIDAEEQQKIVSKLERCRPPGRTAFIQAEMAKPLNFDFFADITHAHGAAGVCRIAHGHQPRYAC